jgi:4a-hydroxytetrahydrobiopterin dehydratase
MMETLAAKRCTPCRGGVPPLTPEQAEDYRAATPHWVLQDEARRIQRTYRFGDFGAAFAFVQRAAELAEAEGHHPDISFGWGYATVSLQTKKIKGLHENDFIMAVKLDRIVVPEPAPASITTGAPADEFANASEIARIVGPLPDSVIAAVLETGATASEVLEAYAWLTADDQLGEELQRQPNGRVAQVYDILAAEEPEDEL